MKMKLMVCVFYIFAFLHFGTSQYFGYIGGSQFGRSQGFSQFGTLSQEDISELPSDLSDDIPDLPDDIAESPKDIPESPKDIPESPKDISESPKDISESPQNIPTSPEDDFDVDFISGYLDKKKSILFYRNIIPKNNKFWLGINVAEASIRGYSCKYSDYGENLYLDNTSAVETISNLKILKSSLISIPKNIFKQYSTVTSFSMTNQRVVQLSDQDFVGATHLKYLNLSHNEITELSSDLFSFVPDLELVDLSFNKINKISASTFNTLNRIEGIILNNNQLTIAHISWFRPTMQAIYLNSNSIRQLSGKIFRSDQFQAIHLEDNVLKDASLLNSVTVSTLNISNNLLGDQHEPIQVDAVIVDISNTNIKNCYISPSVVKMKAANNNITEILITSSLEDVDFNITHLYLGSNYLSSVSNMKHFRKLVTVDLSNNLIEKVNIGDFAGMPNLNSLTLSHNKIHEIDFQTATNPINVEYFNIAYNRLEHFKLNAEFVNLKELQLEGNGLREIDTKMKLMAPNLVKIGLNNNPWSCSYLSTSVMFLRLEGITPTFLENTTSLLKSLNNYDDDVLGIGCLNSQIKGNKELVSVRPTLNEIDVVVDNSLNSKMKDLESKLLDAFNFKFNQIFSLFNNTANTTVN